MNSKNKTVNKIHNMLNDKREKLRDKRQNLRDRIDDKYPYDLYGIKGDMMFEEQSKALDEEIDLLGKYISGMFDLIEIIEGKEE